MTAASSSTGRLPGGPASGPASGAVVAVVGAKGAPGATASVLVLALRWPRPVLVIDADLAGGDVAAGWLAGRVGLDRGLLSFAAATRHATTATPAELGPHVVTVPDAPGVMVLPGLAHGGQAGGLDSHLWTRLLAAATSPWLTAGPDAGLVAGPAAGGGPGVDGQAADGWVAGRGSARVDVLTDCGRVSAGTPWPLLRAASVVLLAARPTLRGVHHARHALASVETALPGVLRDPDRVGLLVCGPGAYDPREVGRAVGLPVRLVLPDDPLAADMLTDYADFGNRHGAGSRRTLLARAARSGALRLSAAVDNQVAAGSDPSGAAPVDNPTGKVRTGFGGTGWNGRR